jgi:GAF domain-containing protein/HAMP domain-containing protein
MNVTDQIGNESHSGKGQASLRTRLTFLILPIILIPFILIGGGAYVRARDILKDQATSQMTSALQAQVESLRDWILLRHSSLYIGASSEQLGEQMALVLEDLDENSIQDLRNSLDEMRSWKDQELFSDLFIAPLDESGNPGQILASTNTTYEGVSLDAIDPLPIDKINTLSFFNLPPLNIDGVVFLSSAPFRSAGAGQADALLIGVNSGLRIGSLLDTMQVYWEQRGIYRIERGNTMILMQPDISIQLPRYSVEPLATTNLDHPVFNVPVTDSSSTLEYSNSEGERLLGAYQWLPELNIGLVVELPQEQAFMGLNTLAPFTIGLILVTTLLVVLLIPIVARRSLKPLDSLTSFAEQVASGDLEQRVSIESKDEIGRLARSFNHMADELTQVYRSLEQRVIQRTEEIRLAADVARDTTAIQDIKQLLKDAVQLISERFGYYHTAIFLKEEEGEYVRLRAASSEGGKILLRRGHILPIGKTGIVGYVTEVGETRIAQDVSKDALYYANPELPETKAEAVLPLSVSGQVIGALDVQSDEVDAFSEGDIQVLQIIAHQLAVAIENARLLSRQTKLADLRSRVINLVNRLSQQTNFDALLEEIPNSIRETFNVSRVTLGLVEGDDVVVRSVSSAEDAITPSPIDTTPIGEGVLGRTVVLKSPQSITHQPLHELETQDPRSQTSQTIFAIPLIIRDKVTGTLAFESGARSDLSRDEIESLEIIAAQAAISLENSRLLEEMQKNLEQMDALYRQQTAESWEQLLLRQRERGETLIEDGLPSRSISEEEILETSIQLRGEMIGKLNLQGLRTGEWSEEDREILEAVADELATSLEQARLIEEINRKVTQLQTAAEIARSASGFLELNALLTRAVNLIYQRFGFYHISIFLLDDERENAVLMEASGEAGLSLKERQLKLPVGSKSIVGRVAKTGEYYVANQLKTDPYYWPNPLLQESRSELGIPLKIGDDVLGVLDVIHNQLFAFSEDDISVLQILADQVAIAVQNVYLFQQTLQRAQREKSVVEITSRLRAERDIDAMLQAAILEMQRNLGAKKARIQLTSHQTKGTIDNRPVKDNKGNSNPRQIERNYSTIKESD